MWLDPHVLFYEDEVFEKYATNSVFLAGPSSRDGIPDYMWRKDAVFFLRKYGYTGYIIVPEPRGYSFLSKKMTDFTNRAEIPRWERYGLRTATYILFWIPRNREQLLGLTTNREIGQWMGKAEHDSQANKKLFIGWPDGAVNMGSLSMEIEEGKIGHLNGEHFVSLGTMCRAVVSQSEPDSDIPF